MPGIVASWLRGIGHTMNTIGPTLLLRDGADQTYGLRSRLPESNRRPIHYE